MNTHNFIMILALTTGVSALSMQQGPLDAPKIGSKLFTVIAPYNRFISKNPPNIGVYGAGYPMLSRIGRIQLAPEMINNWLPDGLRRSLPPARVPDLTFDVEIDRAAPQTYNMVYHPWAGTWQAAKFFNVNVPMSIFAANGVQYTSTGGIPFNGLSALSVHIHAAEGDAIAYSPNNARFTVSPNRDISTFWSAAFSPDKQHGVVTFHILANSDQAEQIIVDALKASATLGQFLDTLQVGSQRLARPVDQQAVQEAINTIVSIIGARRIAPVPHIDFSDLQDRLERLTRSLTRLEYRLLHPA